MNTEQPRAKGATHQSGGYLRPNVGSIIYNSKGQLLLAKRLKQDIWQFPQGGIQNQEDPRDALYRELHEELGLQEQDVDCTAISKEWHEYYLPKCFLKQSISDAEQTFVGQTQRWFLLRLVADDSVIHFDATGNPEMDNFMWVSYWFPLTKVAYFKYHVYRSVLLEFRHYMPKAQ